MNVELQEKLILFAPEDAKSLLFNLLSNSIKFRSPNRKNKISVETYRYNGHTVLTAKDNGIGIDFEKKKHLFSMFKRVDGHSDASGVG